MHARVVCRARVDNDTQQRKERKKKERERREDKKGNVKGNMKERNVI